jgi:hypothetical protein
MPPPKKRIDKNTGLSESRPLDSYFGSKKTSSNSNIAIQVANEPIPVNITSLELIPPTKSNSPTSRENILSNLRGQKILYNLQEIKGKIEVLTENELAEIFKIIKKNNEKYSTNKNGIFVNLTTLKRCTVIELSNFLYFCENNDKIFDKEEEERAKYKEMITDG